MANTFLSPLTAHEQGRYDFLKSLPPTQLTEVQNDDFHALSTRPILKQKPLTQTDRYRLSTLQTALATGDLHDDEVAELIDLEERAGLIPTQKPESSRMSVIEVHGKVTIPEGYSRKKAITPMTQDERDRLEQLEKKFTFIPMTEDELGELSVLRHQELLFPTFKQAIKEGEKNPPEDLHTQVMQATSREEVDAVMSHTFVEAYRKNTEDDSLTVQNTRFEDGPKTVSSEIYIPNAREAAEFAMERVLKYVGFKSAQRGTTRTRTAQRLVRTLEMLHENGLI